MATTVGQHSVAAFTSPINGTTPIDANTVRSNDNTVRLAYVDHDADTGIHVQSSTLASRPVAGTAGRKWITEDSGVYTLWFDDGTNWHPVSSEAVALTVLCTTALNKGDVVKVVGWNTGQDLPEVAKVASSSDIAFAVMTANATINTMGYATNTGVLQDIATNTFSVGDILYPNTTGGFTATKPTSGVYQPVAFVLRSNASNGVIYVVFSAPRIVEASTNTASTVVLRDGSGNFAAGTITANLTGNISGTAPAGTLTGSTLASGVTASSLTSVGTLASLAVSGNVTVDTNTLFVDATNNRVGIGTATPGAALDVASGISRFAGAGGVHTAIGNAFLVGQAELYTISAASFGIGTVGTQPLRFYTDSALRATLDTSGNLGLGVVPSASWSAGFKAFQVGAQSAGISASTSAPQVWLSSNGIYNGTNWIYGNTAAAGQHQIDGNAHKWFIAPSGTAGNAITFTQAMTLDASGNLLVGSALGDVAKLSITGPTGLAGNGLSIYETSTGNTNRLRIYQDNGFAVYNATFGAGNNYHMWQTANAERMRLDSTGLGIGGVTPVYRLDVSVGAGAGNIFRAAQSAVSNGYTITTSGTALTHTWQNTSTNAMMLDASGNLGIGVTPSTASIRTLQVVNTSLSSPGTDMYLTANAVFNSPNWVYLTSSTAAQYVQSAGTHAWLNASSGTAGATVSLTQRMVLDASGNLLIGGYMRVGAASAGATSTTTIGSTTATTVGAAGGASALPATPLGYIIAHVGTTQVKIPYYTA